MKLTANIQGLTHRAVSDLDLILMPRGAACQDHELFLLSLYGRGT